MMLISKSKFATDSVIFKIWHAFFLDSLKMILSKKLFTRLANVNVRRRENEIERRKENEMRFVSNMYHILCFSIQFLLFYSSVSNYFYYFILLLFLLYFN